MPSAAATAWPRRPDNAIAAPHNPTPAATTPMLNRSMTVVDVDSSICTQAIRIQVVQATAVAATTTTSITNSKVDYAPRLVPSRFRIVTPAQLEAKSVENNAAFHTIWTVALRIVHKSVHNTAALSAREGPGNRLETQHSRLWDPFSSRPNTTPASSSRLLVPSGRRLQILE